MSFVRDLRLAFRSLGRSRSFSLLAIVGLGLGLGGLATLAAVVDSVLLRPLPLREPERLVAVWNHLTRMNLPWIEGARNEYLTYAEQPELFERVGAFVSIASATLIEGGEPETVGIGVATGTAFEVLGLEPLHGRWFLPEEVSPGRDDVVLLSHRLWLRRFGGDPTIVGRSINIDGDPNTVVGILPPEASLPDGRVQIWWPLVLDLANLPPPGQQRHLRILGRLRSGLSLEAARAQLATLAVRIAQDNPETYARQGWRPEILPLAERMVAPVKRPLELLLAAALCVLLIVCANLATLYLVRALGREGEVATRIALGAQPPQLVRSLLVESGLLGLLGALLGLVLAAFAVSALRGLGPELLPRVEELRLGWLPIVVTLGFGLLAGLLLGLAPAFQVFGRRQRASLGQSSRAAVGGNRGRELLRRSLVVAEIAVAFSLLAAAGLLLRSLAAAQRVDPGFDPRGVLSAHVELHYLRHREPAVAGAFYRSLVDNLRALPAVEAAGAISILPFGGGSAMSSFAVEGRSVGAGEEEPTADVRAVTPGFFETVGVRPLQGRLFDARDHREAQPVVIIDRGLAERYFEGLDPIGRRIKRASAGDWPWMTIVGVVDTLKLEALDQPSRPQFFQPHPQAAELTMGLVVRAKGEPLALAGEMRKQVWALDPLLPVSEVRPLADLVDGSLALRRLSSRLLVAFSGFALGLAAVGLFGIVAFGVVQRRREIGLRLALGAERAQVVRLFLLEAGRLAGLGLLLGLGLSVFASRGFSSLLFGVTHHDPTTLLLVAWVLLGVVLIAAFWPARLASRIPPADVLRGE